MSSKNTPIIEHTDCLGRNLKEGDCVAVAHRNQLLVAVVKALHTKMITVKTLGIYSGTYKKYASECALLEGPEVTMYLLTNSNR
jgi:hypothetical protein